MLKELNAGLTVGLLSLAVCINAQAASDNAEPSHENMQQADSMEHMKMHEQHMQQLRAGTMPMMEGCEHMKKDRPMADNMMQMRQQRMWQDQQGGMPMMDPRRRDYMMQMRQQRMGQRGMMRQEMMQMRQQHMKNMEHRLANIEKLLTELVELQKK